MLNPGLQYDGFGAGNGITQQDAAMAAAALQNQHTLGLSSEGQQQQEQQRFIAELVSISPSVINAVHVLLQTLCRSQFVQQGSSSSTCMHKAALSACRTAWLFEGKAVTALSQQCCDCGASFTCVLAVCSCHIATLRSTAIVMHSVCQHKLSSKASFASPQKAVLIMLRMTWVETQVLLQSCY